MFVCAPALETLGKLDAVALAPHAAALVATLAACSYDTRKAAWEVLTKLGAEEMLAQHAAILVAKLEDSDAEVRQAAVEALGRLPPEELATHAPALRRIAASDRYHEDWGSFSYVVRDAATEVLAKLPVHLATLSQADFDSSFAEATKEKGGGGGAPYTPPNIPECHRGSVYHVPGLGWVNR